MPAAFGTIDHNRLIERLSTLYGILGTPFTWFSLYLTGKRKTVTINNCFSTALPTVCGIPQGSVLGPLLFTLYTSPLGIVILTHNLQATRSLRLLKSFLQDIFYWMTDSKLKLNADNTVFLIIGTPLQRSKLDDLFPVMYPESKLNTSVKVLLQFLSYRRSSPHLPIYVSLSRNTYRNSSC